MAKKQKSKVEQSTNEVVAQVESMVEQVIGTEVIETQVIEGQCLDVDPVQEIIEEYREAGQELTIEQAQKIVDGLVKPEDQAKVMPNKVHRDRGIGARAKTLILENPNMSNKAIAALVKIEFGDAATTDKCIAWYKSKMRKNGELPARITKSQVEQPQVEEVQA